MATLQGSWIWYELMTTDAAASKAFYDKVVGWNIQLTHGGGADGSGPGDKPYGFLHNADGTTTGGMLHLDDQMCQQGARPCWLGYLGVDDVDAALETIKRHGGHVVMPARDVEMAGRIALVADPSGAPFYIIKPIPLGDGKASTSFSPTRMGSCAWNELVAEGQQRAIDFYTQVFGWTRDQTPMDMGDMGSYVFVEHDGVSIGAIMERPKEMPVSAWAHYFRAPSIAAAKQAAEAAGGQVMVGPMEVPGGEWIIQGLDPQGAMFALVGGK